jgi:LmbE family N-acetylglucosaminyl deacetylase
VSQLFYRAHGEFWSLVRRFCMAQLRFVFARRMEASDGSAVIFSPHQDDETLGCGGLIALKRQRRTNVHVAFMTDGSRGCPENATWSPDQLAEIRRSEAVAALRTLDVPAACLTFLGARDGTLATLEPSKELALLRTLEELLEALNPAEVYLPFRGDHHGDHRATHRLVMAALRRSGRRPLIFQYPVWALETPWRAGFRWTELKDLRYVRIEETLSLKATALAEYRSQVEPYPPHGRRGLPSGFLALFLKSYELYLPSPGDADR